MKSKSHLRFLARKLWKVVDPEEQVNLSFSEYSQNFSDTSDVVAAANGTTKADCLRLALDDEVEATFYLHMIHRVMNIYAVVRMAQYIIQHRTPRHLFRAVGPNLQNAVKELSSHPKSITDILPFVQHFFYVWGGFLVTSKRDQEVNAIAEETGSSVKAVEVYLEIIEHIYSGPSSTLFKSMQGLWFMTYVPASIRALGMKHRLAMDPVGYEGVQFFGTAQPAYEAALDRALVSIGGSSGLLY